MNRNLKFQKAGLVLIALTLLVFSYQNCGGEFKVLQSAQTAGLASVAPGATATPAPVDLPPQKVDMVLLFGDSQTVTMSCDGGASWAYHSFDAAHLNDGDGPYSATGLKYQDGAMYRSRGWGGAPSTIEKSTDGIKWDIVKQLPGFLSGFTISGPNFAYADGSSFWHSADSGLTWAETQVTDGARHLHGLNYDFNGTKRMLFYGDGAAILTSTDGGVNWARTYSPAPGDAPCAGVVISGAANLLLAIGETGQVCKSIDGGMTWLKTAMIPGYFDTNKVVWTGTQFIAYPGNQNIIYRSSDGVTWTSQPGGFFSFTQSQIFQNPKTKKFYAYYYADTFMQSDDGIVWTRLEASKQPKQSGGVEYISHLAYGEMMVRAGHPCFR